MSYSGYNNKPKSLDSLLKEFMKRIPRRREMKHGMAMHLWPEIVGERVSRATRNLTFEGDRLIVKVENEAWRNELHMNRFAIKKKLNSRVGGNTIKEIIVRC